MKNPRLLLLPAVLCALLAALVLASGASADTYVGEAISPVNSAIANGEEDLLGTTVEYESAVGSLTVTATTRSAPTENTSLALVGGVFHSPSGNCAYPQTQEESEALYPVLEIDSPYAKVEGHDESVWLFEKKSEEQVTQENSGRAARSVAGAKATLTATPTTAASVVFNCGLVGISRSNEGPTDYVTFPLTRKVEPTPPAVAAPVVITVPVAVPAPILKGALLFPHAAPLKLERERWTTVRFKVSNPGTGAIGPITIKAKAPKGVLLEPGAVKLPALLPGQTWPASFRMKVTDAAKTGSKIALTATATGLSASGSIAIKPTG